MKQRKHILFFFIFILFHKSFACDCGWGGGFLKMAPKTELVALVKVTKYLTFKYIYGKRTPMSMEVEIIDVYKGKETRKTIIVWGDNGALCRPYLSEFDKGKYYVIAFYNGLNVSEFTHVYEKPTDYSISNCGEYWLKVDIKKQIAIGDLIERDTQIQIKLTDLKEQLTNIEISNKQ